MRENETAMACFHGEGTVVFSSGNRYSGAFSRGLLHGHGQHQWPDGLCYTGEFQANKATGQGVSRSRPQENN